MRMLGFGLAQLCFEGPAETLTQTENAQPALMATSLAAIRLKLAVILATGQPGPADQAAFPWRELRLLLKEGRENPNGMNNPVLRMKSRGLSVGSEKGTRLRRRHCGSRVNPGQGMLNTNTRPTHQAQSGTRLFGTTTCAARRDGAAGKGRALPG